MGAFGDPKGRVERAIWIVDPARGADAFQDLRSQAAAAALAFGPAKVRRRDAASVQLGLSTRQACLNVAE